VNYKAILILVAVLAVLSGVFYIVSRPKPETPVEPRTYVWDFRMEDLERIEISLPKTTQGYSWVKKDDQYFYFDEPNGTQVDMQRWGGGIPLILSGPGAQRPIGEVINDSQLGQYGFNDPNIKIKLTLATEEIFNVVVGDSVPSGNAYYIKMAESKNVYTVDSSWYDVVSRLVTEPPYEPANIKGTAITFNPSSPAVGQPIVIQLTVTNTGAVEGSADITLKINNVEVGTESVTLAGGGQQIFEFTTSVDKPGVYSLTAGGFAKAMPVK